MEKAKTRKFSMEKEPTVSELLDFLADHYGGDFVTYVYDPDEKKMRTTAIGDVVVLVNYLSVGPQRFHEYTLKNGDLVTITEPIC